MHLRPGGDAQPPQAGRRVRAAGQFLLQRRAQRRRPSMGRTRPTSPTTSRKAFGGWPRSYPYAGGDALAYASSGFLWDNALAHKKTLRVYGEFVKATIRWKDPSDKGRPDVHGLLPRLSGPDRQDRHSRRRPRSRRSNPTSAPRRSAFPASCPTSIGPISSTAS